jgi:hypothetical protein
MIFEFTLKVKLTGVAVIVLELSSYVKFTVEKKMGGGGVSLLYDTFCTYSHLSHIDVKIPFL